MEERNGDFGPHVERASRSCEATSYTTGGKDWATVFAALQGPGRREFKLICEDGRLVELVESPAPTERRTNSVGIGYITMGEAAQLLHFNYFTLSRQWRRLGLKPRPVGKRYLFSLDDIHSMIARQRTPKAGRRHRVVGLM